MNIKQKIKDNFPAILMMTIGVTIFTAITFIYVIPQVQYLEYVQTHDTLTSTYTGTLSHYKQENTGIFDEPKITTLKFADGNTFWIGGIQYFDVGANYTITYQTYNNYIASPNDISLEET